MKNEMWKTIGVSVLTSVIVFIVLYFAFGSLIQLGPSASPTGGVTPKEINANRCQADGVCEVNNLDAGYVYAREAVRSTSFCIGNDCKESWSDGAIWLKFRVNEDLTSGRNETTVTNLNTGESWDERVEGSIVSIGQYHLHILKIDYWPLARSVTVRLTGDNGYLIPAPDEMKITNDLINQEVSYNGNDLRLLIIPR